MDLYVSNMWSSAGNRVAYQRQFQTDAGEAALAEMRRHARGNSLFMNADDGTFRDVSTGECGDDGTMGLVLAFCRFEHRWMGRLGGGQRLHHPAG